MPVIVGTIFRNESFDVYSQECVVSKGFRSQYFFRFTFILFCLFLCCSASAKQWYPLHSRLLR
jgi:hypothetical protein